MEANPPEGGTLFERILRGSPWFDRATLVNSYFGGSTSVGDVWIPLILVPEGRTFTLTRVGSGSDVDQPRICPIGRSAWWSFASDQIPHHAFEPMVYQSSADPDRPFGTLQLPILIEPLTFEGGHTFGVFIHETFLSLVASAFFGGGFAADGAWRYTGEIL